jgi:hypothetical protein
MPLSLTEECSVVWFLIRHISVGDNGKCPVGSVSVVVYK